MVYVVSAPSLGVSMQILQKFALTMPVSESEEKERWA